MTFERLNGPFMVKNVCLNANIFTLGAFLSEIEPFYLEGFCPRHFGRHFGRHLNLRAMISLYMSGGWLG